MSFLSWAATVAKGVIEEHLDNQGAPTTNIAETHVAPQPVSTLSVGDAISQAGSNIETAASLLWALDANRLSPGKHYVLNPQSKTEHTSHDAARDPLIVQISSSVWQRPTFSIFKRLLDNYTTETGVPEVVSQDERGEEEAFLNAICETACIQFVYNWLNENSDNSYSSMEDFKGALRDMWFGLYGRDSARDSSGFEHVFCGEIDEGAVKGLHNFIQVYVEEQRGNFNYQGYLDVRGDPSPDAPPSAQQMLLIRFEWLGRTKTVSSMFVGTSPEFEVALYSLLWLGGSPEARVQLGPYSTQVKIYDMHGKIGSAFPQLLEVDESKLDTVAADPPAEVPDYNGTTQPPETSNAASYDESFPALG